MPLSKKHLNDVCLLYHGGSDQCRYLEEDPNTWTFHCLKQRPGRKHAIDVDVTRLIDECRRKGLDPDDQGFPLGDNCDGYPILKHKEQGYDID
jgi:hypothetical protein